MNLFPSTGFTTNSIMLCGFTCKDASHVLLRREILDFGVSRGALWPAIAWSLGCSLAPFPGEIIRFRGLPGCVRVSLSAESFTMRKLHFRGFPGCGSASPPKAFPDEDASVLGLPGCVVAPRSEAFCDQNPSEFGVSWAGMHFGVTSEGFPQ